MENKLYYRDDCNEDFLKDRKIAVIGDSDTAIEVAKRINAVGMKAEIGMEKRLIKENNFIILTAKELFKEYEEELRTDMIYGDGLLTLYSMSEDKVEMPQYIDIINFFKNEEDCHWKIEVCQNYTSYGLQLGLAFAWAVGVADEGIEAKE